MKILGTLFLVMGLLLVISTTLAAQEVGDYQTNNASGNFNWGSAQAWHTWNGSQWVPIGTPPTGSETIYIQEGDSIFVNVEVTITGSIVNRGRITANDNLTIADGGIYNHNRDEGQIPAAVWSEGSILLMTGTVSTAPDDRNQNYHHIIFDTPDMLSNLNMNLDSVIIGGDIIVRNTGVARWYLTSAVATDSSTITIMGDVIAENGNFAVHGTSNALTRFTVHHYGNIIVTGGNFSISRGTQANGTTMWYLYGGDFSMSNATTQSSTATPGGARFVFAGEETQTLTLGEGNTLSALPIEVLGGSTLDMGVSELAGGGMFDLREDATLVSAHPDGINGNLGGIVAAVTLEEDANFVFNGATAQVTGTLMPTVVNNLTIDNAEGVALSQETTINGVLRLVSGVFDNTIPFTLGPSGSISEEGGSLLIPVTSVEEIEGPIPRTFFMDQNYPNPFNPATVIRFGVPSASFVSVKIFNMLGQEVASLFEGHKDPGVYEVQVDASNLGSGIYLYRVQAGDAVSTKRMVLVK
jgi:hypothetical protein